MAIVGDHLPFCFCPLLSRVVGSIPTPRLLVLSLFLFWSGSPSLSLGYFAVLKRLGRVSGRTGAVVGSAAALSATEKELQP